jgi:hypothetical protein
MPLMMTRFMLLSVLLALLPWPRPPYPESIGLSSREAVYASLGGLQRHRFASAKRPCGKTLRRRYTPAGCTDEGNAKHDDTFTRTAAPGLSGRSFRSAAG